MSAYSCQLQKRIRQARRQAANFFASLRDPEHGWRYTATHAVREYPAATLYGTWSAILGLQLLREAHCWSQEEKSWAIERLNRHRRGDRCYLGVGLEDQRNSKSVEYLILHCTNYSVGAALELDPSFDFDTPYFRRFLDGDVLAAWLDGRSLTRPWEEGNNIVNVASYLALSHQHDVAGAAERLEQLLDWHRKYQNPKTGGFDCFSSPNFKQRMESLAGAVHNFHLHLYLNVPLRNESVIAAALPGYLMMGRLTACLSLDFVELAMRVMPFSAEPQKLVWALLHHVECLLESQQPDGGWWEDENGRWPVVAAGFRDSAVSSCSYATWFRLASLGMIAIVLLGDDPADWGFRRSLGMGYAPTYWPRVPTRVCVDPATWHYRCGARLTAAPRTVKARLVRLAGRFL
jgi:hypothetical protein